MSPAGVRVCKPLYFRTVQTLRRLVPPSYDWKTS